MATTITPVQLLVTALEMESARSRLLVRKLGFLKGTLSNWCRCCCYEVNGLWLCLVKECRELEERFGSLHRKDFKWRFWADQYARGEKVVGQLDKKKRIEQCDEKAPKIAMVQRMAETVDIVLDLGEQHTRGLQIISRLLSRSSYKVHRCHWGARFNWIAMAVIAQQVLWHGMRQITICAYLILHNHKGKNVTQVFSFLRY